MTENQQRLLVVGTRILTGVAVAAVLWFGGGWLIGAARGWNWPLIGTSLVGFAAAMALAQVLSSGPSQASRLEAEERRRNRCAELYEEALDWLAASEFLREFRGRLKNEDIERQLVILAGDQVLTAWIDLAEAMTLESRVEALEALARAMRDDLGRSNHHLRGRSFSWLLTPGAARSSILADEAPEPAVPRQRSYRRRKNSERS